MEVNDPRVICAGKKNSQKPDFQQSHDPKTCSRLEQF